MSDRLIILTGDALEMLRTLNGQSVHCCVTSPPYWGLRDYGVAGQIGLERTIDEYVGKMVEVFDEVRRVLVRHGTLWVNLGDIYAHSGACGGGSPVGARRGRKDDRVAQIKTSGTLSGLKPKDLCGIPWRVALALQASGWWLRQDIIWNKPNPMPESITDRCTKSHEYLFLLSRSDRYWWDKSAMMEPVTGTSHDRGTGVNPKAKLPAGWDVSVGEGGHGGIHRNGRSPKSKQNASFSGAVSGLVDNRNRRSVWTVPTYSYSEAHFATYPPDLIKPCILAGCPAGGTVLDPFAGSGTTGAVALELGRKALLIELNPEYVKLIRQRCDVTPGFHFESKPQ